MAVGKTESITQRFVNNSTSPSTVTDTVTQVVVDGRLVPDFRDINAGVIDAGFKRT